MAKLELLCNRLIARQVRLMQIIQQATALPDHFQQATTGAVVLDVLLQMLGQVVDPLRQQRDLHIRRSGVFLVQLETVNGLNFRFHNSNSIVRSKFKVCENKFIHTPCKALFGAILDGRFITMTLG